VAVVPTAIALDEAFAELDSLPTPAGVDESLFSQLKRALPEVLVHGAGARHAVLLRENQAQLERVGRGFIPAAPDIPAEEETARLKSRPTHSSPTTNNQHGLPERKGRTRRSAKGG